MIAIYNAYKTHESIRAQNIIKLHIIEFLAKAFTTFALMFIVNISRC